MALITAFKDKRPAAVFSRDRMEISVSGENGVLVFDYDDDYVGFNGPMLGAGGAGSDIEIETFDPNTGATTPIKRPVLRIPPTVIVRKYRAYEPKTSAKPKASGAPSGKPSAVPSAKPSAVPSAKPSAVPSVAPSAVPSVAPVLPPPGGREPPAQPPSGLIDWAKKFKGSLEKGKGEKKDGGDAGASPNLMSTGGGVRGGKGSGPGTSSGGAGGGSATSVGGSSGSGSRGSLPDGSFGGGSIGTGSTSTGGGTGGSGDSSVTGINTGTGTGPEGSVGSGINSGETGTGGVTKDGGGGAIGSGSGSGEVGGDTGSKEVGTGGDAVGGGTGAPGGQNHREGKTEGGQQHGGGEGKDEGDGESGSEDEGGDTSRPPPDDGSKPVADFAFDDGGRDLGGGGGAEGYDPNLLTNLLLGGSRRPGARGYGPSFGDLAPGVRGGEGGYDDVPTVSAGVAREGFSDRVGINLLTGGDPEGGGGSYIEGAMAAAATAFAAGKKAANDGNPMADQMDAMAAGVGAIRPGFDIGETGGDPDRINEFDHRGMLAPAAAATGTHMSRSGGIGRGAAPPIAVNAGAILGAMGQLDLKKGG